MKHILIATDLSDTSAPAIVHGGTIAKKLGARITLAHVYNTTPDVPPVALGPYAVIAEQVDEEVRPKIDALLGKIRDKELSDLQGLQTITLSHTNPAAAICDFASENGVDLIVVGSHGRTGSARLLLGSVAEKIARTAACSVLVAR